MSGGLRGPEESPQPQPPGAHRLENPPTLTLVSSDFPIRKKRECISGTGPLIQMLLMWVCI